MMNPADAKKAIYNTLDLTAVKTQIAAQMHWTQQQADEAELWYRHFLWVVYSNGGFPVYVMDKNSDYIWHAHCAQYNPDYVNFCVNVFGHVIEHHTIPPAPPVTPAQFLLGQSLYQRIIGKPVPYASTACY